MLSQARILRRVLETRRDLLSLYSSKSPLAKAGVKKLARNNNNNNNNKRIQQINAKSVQDMPQLGGKGDPLGIA